MDVRTLCKHGRLKEALHILDLMDQMIMPNSGIYVSLLEGCINMKALTEGRQVHAHILKCGLKLDIFLGNTLVNMYSKCGSIVDARQVFDELPERDVVTWNIMISGYARHGHAEEAVKLFQRMKCYGMTPNKVTFLSIVKACTSLADLDQGMQIHAQIIKSGYEEDAFVGSILVDMYAKCRSIDHARIVFDKMPKRDVVAWTAMIGGYVEQGNSEEALKLFEQMEHKGLKPDKVTFLSILKACANAATLEQGKEIHAYIIRSGFESDPFVGSALVDMYAKCGTVDLARQMFDIIHNREVVTWNAMISGYARGTNAAEAFKLFQQMEQENVKPDKITFLSMLKACTSLAALEEGEKIHARIIKSGYKSDVSLQNTLVDMYCKCGCIEHARRVFNKMHKREVASWNAMIAGYTWHGNADEAFKLFRKMELEGVKPDEVTFVSILKSCANSAALEEGKRLHADIVKGGYDSNIFIGNALIDMYAKCGSIDLAYQVFNCMSKRDVISWNAVITGLAQHGHGKEALQLVGLMQQEGMKLDYITFVSIFSACSHAGLVDEGHDYFDLMVQKYGITPTPEHCSCMVDLLGRAGSLEEAQDFIKRMPSQPSAMLWTTLLGACRLHGNMELARRVAEHILDFEPENAATFVQLSNMYAAAGRWDDKAKWIKAVIGRGVKWEQGFSHIEVNDQVHKFSVGEASHPELKEIHVELKRLSCQMEKAGYVPDTCFVPASVEEEKQQLTLCHHTEKLAIAFGLLSTLPGTIIRVFKNHWICGDCHTASKFISSVVGREIIVRDANQLHHVKNGVCSCGDY